MENKPRYVCVVMPAYREAGRIGPLVKDVLRFCGDIIVVDDGSGDGTAEAAGAAGATVIRHAVNRGKGSALETGFYEAEKRGFAYVITMDGDGQHDPSDIPALLGAVTGSRTRVVVGNRMDHPGGMPLIGRCANRFMSWLLSREMGQRVPDTQCGFRLYAVAALRGVAVKADRFEAESEVLLALASHGEKIESVPVRIIYGDERSKIRPFRDTVRFFRMLRRVRHCYR